MRSATSTGFAYAVTGFAMLSVGDGVIKSMAGDWPPVAVAALRFTIGALGLSILLWRKEGPEAFIPSNPWLQIGRGACLALTSVAFFSAIYVMALAEAMAIAFLAPILTQLLAGLILGERVPGRIYAISLVAFAGVAIVLRPNLEALGPAAFLPLVSAIFFALLMVLNRASAGQGSALSMQLFVAAFCAPILIVLAVIAKISGVPALDFGWPSWDVVARCALVALSASTAHYLAYLGIQRAGAAQVAPAIYVQMLVAIIMGALFFGDIPDLMTLLGGALIISAGLYLWRDGVLRARTPESSAGRASA